MEGIEMKKTDYDQDTYYKRVEKDLKPLILITLKAEELIADYALVKTEDLWDEEYDQVVRALFFEQGSSEFIVSITPQGLIRDTHTDYPEQLSFQLHNIVVGLYAGGWMDS